MPRLGLHYNANTFFSILVEAKGAGQRIMACLWALKIQAAKMQDVKITNQIVGREIRAGLMYVGPYGLDTFTGPALLYLLSSCTCTEGQGYHRRKKLNCKCP